MKYSFYIVTAIVTLITLGMTIPVALTTKRTSPLIAGLGPYEYYTYAIVIVITLLAFVYLIRRRKEEKR